MYKIYVTYYSLLWQNIIIMVINFQFKITFTCVEQNRLKCQLLTFSEFHGVCRAYYNDNTNIVYMQLKYRCFVRGLMKEKENCKISIKDCTTMYIRKTLCSCSIAYAYGENILSLSIFYLCPTFMSIIYISPYLCILYLPTSNSISVILFVILPVLA